VSNTPQAVAGQMARDYGVGPALTLAADRLRAARTSPFWYEVCVALLAKLPAGNP